jgi:hypothetical protein
MKRSRSAAILGMTLALLATGCSRFAPKAGVDINTVNVDLAFGVDIEKLLETPTATPPPPPVIDLPTVPPPSTPPPPPEPPEPPPCPVNTNPSTRDGEAGTNIAKQEFREGGTGASGAMPRSGDYFTWYEYNHSGEPARKGFDYKSIGRIRNLVQPEGAFSYEVEDSPQGHGIDWTFVIVPGSDSAENPSAAAGIYLQEMHLPTKDRSEKQQFVVTDPGTKLVDFPIQNGNRSEDSQPVPSDPNTNDTIPSFGTANVMKITSTVGSRDTVYVCEELADSWRVGVTIELTGPDADVKLIGNFWIAPQYGGWPIQELFTIDGGAAHMSGNYFTRLSRLDPGKVA